MGGEKTKCVSSYSQSILQLTPFVIPHMAKLSWLYTKYTIHWKTFAVHQAMAIMYCTQQVIQGENFRDHLKNHENRKTFPTRNVLLYTVSFAPI